MRRGEDSQREDNKRKDRFDTLVYVCLHWNIEDRWVRWCVGGWSEQSARKTIRDGIYGRKFVFCDREVAE